MPQTGPLRVLLVEDDDAYAELMRSELQTSSGAVVQRVATLAGALEALAGGGFNVVLLDIGLPDAGGLETVARVHAAAPDLALVVLTSCADDQLGVAAVQHGAQDYLLKTSTDGPTLHRALRYARERAAFRSALRDSDALKAAIVNTAFDAIVTIDGAGTISEFNRAAEGLFGFSRAEALGRDVADLIIPPGDRPRHRTALAALEHTKPTGVLRRRMEVDALRADGSTVPIELALVALPSSQGPLFTAFMRDLSEQRNAEAALRDREDQLRQAHKMEAVGRLAGGVAHDFNNVLTAIFGYSELLLDQFAQDDPRRADLEEIRRSAERAAALTRQLLAFSRKQVMQPRILELNLVIANLRKLLVALVGEDVLFEVRLSPDLWSVRADPGQLEQVLMNLAANARDAMPEGGQLVVETANVIVESVDLKNRPGLKPGEYATMTVRDTGRGIPENIKQHIFEPFFTTKELGKGTGLGLATVYGIVKQTGGGVYVESEDQGTRFVIYLPRVP